jgi:hypothetical protein
MNDLTNNWNASVLYDQHVFQDVVTGTQITVAANNPVNVRAFKDAVAAGAYIQVSP